MGNFRSKASVLLIAVPTCLYRDRYGVIKYVGGINSCLIRPKGIIETLFYV